MVFPYVLRQPLTGEMKRLQHSAAEYLESMRLYSQQNGYNIQELFEDEDDEKVGSVPEYAFLYLIRKKFQGQTGFSMDQVRHITNFFQVPDGTIWYSRLHLLMKSDESVLDQVRKASKKVPYFSGIPSTPLFPSAQVSAFRDNSSPPPFKFSLTCPHFEQDVKSPASFESTSTGLKTNFSFAAKGDLTTAPPAVFAPGFFFGANSNIVKGNRQATCGEASSGTCGEDVI